MNEFEHAILRVLKKAKEPLGWYQIERQLSTMSLIERPNLLEALGELERRELITQEIAANTRNMRHAITQAGIAAIS